MKTVVYFAALILQFLTSSALQFSPFNAPYLWHGGNFILVRLIPEFTMQNGTQSLISPMIDYKDVIRSQPYTGSHSQPYNGYESQPYTGSYSQPYNGYGSQPYAGSYSRPYYGYGSQPYSGSYSRPYYGYGSQPYPGKYSLADHIRSLVDKIIYLRREVLKLERERPKCNSLTPAEGSKVLGSLCYTIIPTQASYPVALAYCRSIGGTLAEPYQPFSHALYEDLEHEFPIQFTLIQSLGDQLWIGPRAGSGSGSAFEWPSTGTDLVPQPTFDPPDSITVPRGVLMTVEGKKWKAAAKTELHPYVCSSIPL